LPEFHGGYTVQCVHVTTESVIFKCDFSLKITTQVALCVWTVGWAWEPALRKMPAMPCWTWRVTTRMKCVAREHAPSGQ